MCRFNRVPRPGQTPARVAAVALALALPRHVLGCLLSGQPAVPPDADTGSLTSAVIESSSHFDHIAKALTLLTSLCELSFHHRGLRDAVLTHPEFGTQLVDAANMVLLAVTGPEADVCMSAAGEQARVQAALDRAAMVPAALRALAFAFTARNGAQAAAAAVGGVLDWQAICEAVLTVRCHQHARCMNGSAWLVACSLGSGGCDMCRLLPPTTCHPSPGAASAWCHAAGGRL